MCMSRICYYYRIILGKCIYDQEELESIKQNASYVKDLYRLRIQLNVNIVNDIVI